MCWGVCCAILIVSMWDGEEGVWVRYYVAFCVTLAALTAVPEARTLEAKSARTRMVSAKLAKSGDERAMLAFDEKLVRWKSLSDSRRSGRVSSSGELKEKLKSRRENEK